MGVVLNDETMKLVNENFDVSNYSQLIAFIKIQSLHYEP